MNAKILLIDEHVELGKMLRHFLGRHNYQVTHALTAGTATPELESENPPDIVLTEYVLPDTNGKDLLLKIRAMLPGVPVIVLTAYHDIEVAVDLMKNGAFDFASKPLFPEEFLNTIRKATSASKGLPNEELAGRQEKTVAVPKKKNIRAKYIFGENPQFKEILKQVNLVAPTNYSVIIFGESGSGKEAIAQEIHARSKRKNAPFIAIDCGVLSDELAASELFGHEKGSFTDAENLKTGSMELANGGTIFMDEISNLSYSNQVSLLRVVQERKLTRVGGTKDIDLDIRIIVATNYRLEEAVKKGTFREDLFHRFNEFTINLPPLRERRNDIITFAHFFMEQSNDELDKNLKGFAPQVEKIFKVYDWPGNLRELKNVVKRAALLTTDDVIEMEALPFELVNHSSCQVLTHTKSAVADHHPVFTFNREKRDLTKNTLRTVSIDAEYQMIVDALKKSNFNKSKAAKLLNVDRKTLYNKIKLHGQNNAMM